MPDRMRWRYGDTNPVIAAVDAETVIEIGDLLWQDRDDAKPAGAMLLPYVFAHSFLGVAMQRSVAGQSDLIRVATSGVFEFDCGAAAGELGDFVEADHVEDASRRADNDRPLENQRVKITGCKLSAIGRVAKRKAASEKSVLVEIQSVVMRGPIR